MREGKHSVAPLLGISCFITGMSTLVAPHLLTFGVAKI